MGQTTGQHGQYRRAQADGWASCRLSHHLDNRIGNDETEDRTAWSDAQAIQLLQSEYLFPRPMWMGHNACVSDSDAAHLTGRVLCHGTSVRPSGRFMSIRNIVVVVAVVIIIIIQF